MRKLKLFGCHAAKHTCACWFILFIAVTILTSACKKEKREDANVSLPSKAAVDAMIASQPQYVTFPVNQRMERASEDEFGNPINYTRTGTDGSGTGCENVPMPEATLESWGAIAKCDRNNNHVRATISVSSVNVVEAGRKGFPGSLTRGYMRVTKLVSGALVYQHVSITPVSILDSGVDPTDPTRHIYKVSWFLDGVPDVAFERGNTIRLGLYYYTDCPDEAPPAGFGVTAVANYPAGAAACNVAHPITIVPAGTGGYVYAAGECASCFNWPDLPERQEFYYRTSYAAAVADRIGGPYSIVKIGSPVVLSAMTPGITYYFMYRNAGITCTGPPTQTPTAVVWY